MKATELVQITLQLLKYLMFQMTHDFFTLVASAPK